jgi:hypothetical protein
MMRMLTVIPVAVMAVWAGAANAQLGGMGPMGALDFDAVENFWSEHGSCRSDGVCERNVRERQRRRADEIGKGGDVETARVLQDLIAGLGQDSGVAVEQSRHAAALRRFEQQASAATAHFRAERRNCRNDAACERLVQEQEALRMIEIENAKDRENALHDKAAIDLRPAPPTAGFAPALAEEQLRHDAALRELEQEGIDAEAEHRINRRNCRNDGACERVVAEQKADRVREIANARTRETAAHQERLANLRRTGRGADLPIGSMLGP